MSINPMPTTRKAIKIVQLNMAKSQAVSDQVLVYCQKEHIDVLLAQKPYTRYGKIPPSNLHLTELYSRRVGDRVGGGQSITTWSAIVVLNPQLEVLALSHLSSMHCVVTRVGYPGSLSMIVISAYFQFRRATENFTHELHQIIRTLSPQDNLIIRADVNAFSTRWGIRITDHRGAVVKDFIDQETLTLVNTSNHEPTYEGPRGSKDHYKVFLFVLLEKPGPLSNFAPSKHERTLKKF